MVRVAIAGGTGSLGRTLVEAIVEREGHDVFVTTRKVGDLALVLQFIVLVTVDLARSFDDLRPANRHILRAARGNAVGDGL